jgi:chromosome partitioning protein
MIVSVLNIKGGVGKTTVATNLAVGLSKGKNRICIVDADPQGSSLRWSGKRPDDETKVDVVGMADADALRKNIDSIRLNYDIVIIDGAPAVNRMATVCAAISNIILLPLGPSPFDVWATEDMIDRIQQVRDINPLIKAFYLINKHSKRTLISQETEQALGEMETPVLKSNLATRVAYADSATSGLTVLEWDDSKAKEEMLALVEEVKEIIND